MLKGRLSPPHWHPNAVYPPLAETNADSSTLGRNGWDGVGFVEVIH